MYTQTKRLAVEQLGAGTAKVTTATGVAVASFIVMSQFLLETIFAAITTTVANDLVEAEVTVYKRVTIGSDTNREEVGVIKFPDGLAAGKVLYKPVTPIKCEPGDQIIFEVTTAGTDSGAAAGAFLGGFDGNEQPESPANQSDMVLSA